MTSTSPDSLGVGDVVPATEALAMRGEIAKSLFGDVAEPVRIARFEVLEEIGAGGMGVVYRARDPKLERAVALKVLNASGVSTQGRARLVREAQTLARLSHPHVVTVYEVGEHEQQVFLAMEFVDGVNVRDWMHAEQRTEAEILDVFLAAARGLAAAHEAGIVHRDFKPANVLLGKDGRVRVADFGLARDDASRDSTRDSGGQPQPASASGGSVTKTGAVIGTPAYMAPEQWAGKAVTAATDQFSFCVALWEALTGEVPFERDDVRNSNASAEGLGAARQGDSIPARLRKPLLRGLSVEPEARWDDLGSLIQGLSPRRRLPWLGFGGVALVAGLVGASVTTNTVTDPVADPCAAARARMDAASSADEQQRLEAAHAASAPFAAASWPELHRGLQQHEKDWRAAAATVCHKAGPIDPVAVRCLDQSAAQFSAFSARIGESSAQLVSRLPAALAALGNPQLCASPTLASARPSPAEDSELDADVSQVRALTDAARLSLELGEFEHADALVSDALERSRTSAFLPVVAEVQLVRGSILLARGNARDSAERFREALQTAQRSRHDEAVFESLIGFLRAGAFSEPDPATTLQAWTDLAEATLERLGARPELEARLDEARLLMLRFSGRKDQALELAQDLAGRRGEGSTGASRRWARRQEAHLVADSGKRDVAERIYRELLEAAEQRLGAVHPELASLHIALGLLYEDQPKSAAPYFEKARAILSESVGTQDVAYARATLGLAMAQAGLGDLEASERLAKEAAVIQARLLPDKDAERSGALILLAELSNIAEDYEATVAYWKQVLDVTDPEHDAQNYLMALNNVGYWYRKLGKLDESEPYYRKLRAQVEPGSTLHRYASLGLASHKIRHGLNEDARALLVGLDRPMLDAGLTDFGLELWPLRAILDGATSAEWMTWETMRRADGARRDWLLAEVEATRASR